MCFTEREAQNFKVKFREIFPWRQTVLRAHRMNLMKSCFSVKFMRLLGETGTSCDWQVFSLFLKGFEEFSYTQGNH